MADKKTISKDIKFNYFQGYITVDKELYSKNQREINALLKIKEKKKEKKGLSPNQKALLKDEEEIKKMKVIYEEFGRSPWNALDMFTIILEEGIDTNIDIGEINAEIEPNTLLIEGNIVSFQLTKMRDNMLPSKKKKGAQKVDIKLNSDEFMGEFVSVLYDSSNAIFMIQSSMYGLTFGQVEKYLTELRRRVIKETSSGDLIDAACELSIVINTCDIDNIRGSQEVKKMRVRAADGIFDQFTKDNKNYLGAIRKSFGQKTGLVIDITVSIDKETETKSLNKDLVEDVLGNFDIIQNSTYDSNLLVEVTRKETDDSSTEILNLLKPKMSDEITLKLKPRTSVIHADLLKEMKSTYNKRKRKINEIVGE